MPVRIVTDEQKIEMKRLFEEDGWKQEALATMFGIASSTVFGIISGGQRQKSVEDCAMQEPHHQKYHKRFWKKVDTHGGPGKNEEEQCWDWGGGHDGGYGIFRAGPKRYYTHVYAWEIEHKQELGERRLSHAVCHNRGCCNPAHLKLSYTTRKAQTGDELADKIEAAFGAEIKVKKPTRTQREEALKREADEIERNRKLASVPTRKPRGKKVAKEPESVAV